MFLCEIHNRPTILLHPIPSQIRGGASGGGLGTGSFFLDLLGFAGASFFGSSVVFVPGLVWIFSLCFSLSFDLVSGGEGNSCRRGERRGLVGFAGFFGVCGISTVFWY